MLKQIKYEEVHKDRLSTKVVDDLESSKTLCDMLCLKLSENGLAGFLHDIKINPMGFWLCSELQVSLYFNY